MITAKDDPENREEPQIVEQGMLIYMSTLIENSTFDEFVKEDYFRRMSEGMPLEEYERAKLELLNSQQDKITSGLNYGQGDIVKHLGKLK